MNSGLLNRRVMLKLGLTAMAGAAVPGCTARPRPRRSLVPVAAPVLPKVQATEERVIRTVAGLRPYRPSGFVVRAESMGDKLIIHNYGHGGCGVTLSWGTAKLVVEEALAQPYRRAAVLGAGAVGLATARLLQDHGFEVTIYTRDLPPNTTSNIAGGLWAPFSVADFDKRTAAFDAQLAQAIRFSHRYYQTLVGDRYGVRWLPLYMVGDQLPANPPWMWLLTPEIFRQSNLTKQEHPFPRDYAQRLPLMLIEPAQYLRSLLADFRLAGGRLVIRDFPDVGAVLHLSEPVVVNCTGLGAKRLFGDEELLPIRGQLTFLMPQPELNYMYIAGGHYMFPRSDGVLLGGTHERGNWSETPDAETAQQILRSHQELAAGML